MEIPEAAIRAASKEAYWKRGETHDECLRRTLAAALRHMMPRELLLAAAARIESIEGGDDYEADLTRRLREAAGP